MSLLLNLAASSTDRTAALVDGRVRVEGVDLNFFVLSAEEIFFRMIRHSEFDAAEMSLSSYAMLADRSADFIAIPVFPSRAFRHNGIYVNTAGPVSDPKDLVGRVVGVPEYQMTAAVWIRGILADHHGVPPESVSYRTGGLRSPGRQEKVHVTPLGVDVRPIAADVTLTQLLLEGELDALYSPHPPEPFLSGDERIARLWPEPAVEEANYFRATGIFPIMHTVVIRRDVYCANRWLARSLYKAFDQAKRVAESRIAEPGTLATLLPFGYSEAERTRELMGYDFWPYGIEPNRTTVETLMRYGHEQGLLSRRLEVEELFAPETTAEFVI